MKANKKEQREKQREEANKFLVNVEQGITSLHERFEQLRPETNGGTLRNILKDLEELLNSLIKKKKEEPGVYVYHQDNRKRVFRAEFSCHLIIADIETKIAS